MTFPRSMLDPYLNDGCIMFAETLVQASDFFSIENDIITVLTDQGPLRFQVTEFDSGPRVYITTLLT